MAAAKKVDHWKGWVPIRNIPQAEPIAYLREDWAVRHVHGEARPWRIFRPNGMYVRNMGGGCRTFGTPLAAIEVANAHIKAAEWKSESGKKAHGRQT